MEKRTKGFVAIGNAIRHNANTHHLQDALDKYKATTTWQKIITAFVEEAKQLTQVVDLKKGVLTVACLSKDVAYKIKLLSEQIIAALNEMFGRKTVFAIYLET